MTRRERLMASIRGETVDRPPVSFYEINGHDEDPDDTDPFNIYSHPSWHPLIDLAREKTDRILMRGVAFKAITPDALKGLTQDESHLENGSRITTRTISFEGHTLTSRTRRDPDLNTVWTTEHLLKNVEDLHTFLSLPSLDPNETIDTSGFLKAESALGDTGIVMIDTPDPLCLAAGLFDMADYTVIASTERQLFHQLLDYFAQTLLPRTEMAARALPGRLWRIYGPEYASPPYLPPELFREYVGAYVTPMIQIIQHYGGYARLHCHGNIREILPEIVAMGADGLDPIEPPPQGNVQLHEVRSGYGADMTLFGNLEASDIENLSTDAFEKKVQTALEEGTAGDGRGFVLMPSACPYGRVLGDQALRNYEKMVELVDAF